MILLIAGIALPYRFWIDQLGGAFHPQPDRAIQALSPQAQRLVDRAFADVDPGRLRDYHVHVIGNDPGAFGTWVNPRMLAWWGLKHKLIGDVYRSGAGITDIDRLDTQYMTRLIYLIRSMPTRGRFFLLAFDRHYRSVGTTDPARTEFYVPNDYVYGLAHNHPDLFTPVVSVHPYRADALDELRHWRERGVRFVKWLPNAQGMDPADPSIRPFYETLKELGMTLLTHVGEEQAVDAKDAQALGNPLGFRPALDLGVTVIMAHAASLGTHIDLDDPDLPEVPSFDLFVRLMETPEYRGRLFADLSAITQSNRLPRPLAELLRRRDLHPRLINGSDYPLPAINVVIRTRDLARFGFITGDQRRWLNEIYYANPLLFDYVLKRTIRHPQTGERFPASVFMVHSELEPAVLRKPEKGVGDT